MRWLDRFGVVGAASVVFVACVHSNNGPRPVAGNDESAAAASSEMQEAALSLQEHHRHHHHGGLLRFLVLSLDTLGGDPAKQSAIDAIRHDLDEHLAPGREVEKNLIGTLADGIAAGAIDTAKTDAAIAQISRAASTSRDATNDALNRLHALLSPTERTTLVDKVRAHWQVWRRVNYDAEAGGREAGGQLANLSAELNLTQDQTEKLSAALRMASVGASGKFDPSVVDGRVQSFLTTFPGESFDAKTLPLVDDANGGLAVHGANRMVVFYKTVSANLTPEQRTTLAQRLRDHMTFPQPNAAK